MKRKNKVFALLLALCMMPGVLFSCPLFALAADNYTPGYYVSNAEHNIYIRSSSRSDSQSVGVLPKNTIIDVVECIPNDKWGRIVYDGVIGWVRLDLCRSLNVNLYVVRIPDDATPENTDFAAIKTDPVKGDVDGAMICLGRVDRNNAEPYTLNANFAALAAAARKEGLAVGAYYISDAATAEEGKAQGAFVASTLDAANESLKFPVCLFYPSGTLTAEANPAVGEAVSAYAEEIRAKGYYPGVYCDKALAPAAAKNAGKDTYAFWFQDLVSDEITDALVTMWEYRLKMKEEDRKNYYAGNYPMTLCLFDYPTLLTLGCADGKHTPSDTWVVEKEATCTEAGKTVLRCTACRNVIDEKIIEPTGHTPVPNDAVAATCTVDGHSAGVVCSVCGDTLVNPQVWHATGHKWNAGEEKTNEAGETFMLYTCTECGLALQSESCFAAGDISMDGIVTAEDARLALRAAVGLANYMAGGVEFSVADVNDDKAITAEDARSILRAAVGLDELGTVTYLLPDGKVTDRTQPEKPALPPATELTQNEAHDMFAAANALYCGWLSPVRNAPVYDKNDTVDLNGKVYTLIKESNITKVEDLIAACAKYFLPEAYESFIRENYTMVNGKLYGIAPSAEAPAGFAKIKLSVSDLEDDACSINLDLYETKDSEEPKQKVEAPLQWTADGWFFTAEFPYQIGFDAAYEK